MHKQLYTPSSLADNLFQSYPPIQWLCLCLAIIALREKPIPNHPRLRTSQHLIAAVIPVDELECSSSGLAIKLQVQSEIVWTAYEPTTPRKSKTRTVRTPMSVD